jgi:hypothetical protein
MPLHRWLPARLQELAVARKLNVNLGRVYGDRRRQT